MRLQLKKITTTILLDLDSLTSLSYSSNNQILGGKTK